MHARTDKTTHTIEKNQKLAASWKLAKSEKNPRACKNRAAKNRAAKPRPRFASERDPSLRQRETARIPAAQGASAPLWCRCAVYNNSFHVWQKTQSVESGKRHIPTDPRAPPRLSPQKQKESHGVGGVNGSTHTPDSQCNTPTSLVAHCQSVCPPTIPPVRDSAVPAARGGPARRARVTPEQRCVSPPRP